MSSPHQQKEDFLRQHGCLHPHPERVADELFQDSDLNDEVLAVIDALLADDPKLSSADLAARLLNEPGLAVHPRSVERALARRKKKAR